ncbi:MAG: hypothetical protein HFF60_08065 [Oscillospiraceae bacterium]|jgi:hypothetical protein|nr:hypothetical protein [Oscillospiraceae bacterium]
MLTLELAGERLRLDSAAVSALRYRSAYGESVVESLSGAGTAGELEGVLLRMVHSMLPPSSAPDLRELARLARRDGGFVLKALTARDALLAGDSKNPVPLGEAEEGAFDEYKVLALMSTVGIDIGLIYELPILHLLSIVRRCGELRSGEATTYRPMTGVEMTMLYPKRR